MHTPYADSWHRICLRWCGLRELKVGRIVLVHEVGGFGKAAEAVRGESLAMMIFQHRIPWSGGLRCGDRRGPGALGAADEMPGQALPRDDGSSGLLLWGIGPALLALLTGQSSQAARQWLTHTAANVCILGGIVCSPFISMLAWVGMVLPTQAALHQLAPVLMTASLIWLALAIIAAHACRSDVKRKPTGSL